MISRRAVDRRMSAMVGARSCLSVRINSDCTIEGEPSVQELIAADVTRLLMARDGVKDEQLWSLIGQVRSRLL